MQYSHFFFFLSVYLSLSFSLSNFHYRAKTTRRNSSWTIYVRLVAFQYYSVKLDDHRCRTLLERGKHVLFLFNENTKLFFLWYFSLVFCLFLCSMIFNFFIKYEKRYPSLQWNLIATNDLVKKKKNCRTTTTWYKIFFTSMKLCTSLNHYKFLYMLSTKYRIFFNDMCTLSDTKN